jgi:hypothetical protein
MEMKRRGKKGELFRRKKKWMKAGKEEFSV